MKRLTIALAALTIAALSMLAQTNDRSTLVRQMNAIKSQSDRYHWSQFAHPNADSARVYAAQMMLVEINSFRQEGNKLSLQQLLPHVKQVKVDRGSNKQVFVYISKQEAANIGGATAYTPDPVPDPVTAPEPTYTPTPAPAPAPTPQPRQFVPDAFVQRLMQARMFQDVYRMLQALKTQGQVLQFGSLKNVDDYSSLDLILFDKQSQQIITVLSGVGPTGSRTNLVTGDADALDNYPTSMTAAIWYIKK